MELKNKTKFLLVLGIIFVAFLLFNTNKVNATEISDYKCKIEKDGYIFYNNYFNTSDVDTEVKKEINNSIHIYSNKSGINTSTLNDIVNNFKNGKCLVEVSNDVTEAKVIRTVGAPFETKEVEENAEIVVLNNKRYVVVNSKIELSEFSMNDKNYTHVWLYDNFTIKMNDKEQLFVLRFEFYSTDYFRCDVKVVSETGVTYGHTFNTNGIVLGEGLVSIPAKLDFNKTNVEYLSNTYLGETLNIECLGKVPYVGKYGNVYKYKMSLKNVKINETSGTKTIHLADFSYKDSFEVGDFELDPNYTIDNETYVEQTKTNTSTKLKFDLRGNFKGTLKAEEISKNDLIYNKVNEELRNHMNNNNSLYIDISNIYIEDGSYEGPLKLTFYVGEQYNGKYYSICHMKDYMYNFEEFNGIVENGKIEITVDSLSPFGISIFEKKEETPTTDSTPKVDKGEKDETPKTGTVDIIGYVLGVTLLTGVGIVELKKRLK